MEYTIGKAAKRPAPPSTSQVSLPSHTGATEFIMVSRPSSLGAKGKRIPTPRSNPSISTYMMMPKPIMNAQIRGRSNSSIISDLPGWPVYPDARHLQSQKAHAPQRRDVSAARPHARLHPGLQDRHTAPASDNTRRQRTPERTPRHSR